jgi:hypothetical protein
MTARSPVSDRGAMDRSVKVCGMFGSSHDGERANAALKADSIVRGMGQSWTDLLDGARRPCPVTASAPLSSDWRLLARPATDEDKAVASEKVEARQP